jgi:hypothetical protein
MDYSDAKTTVRLVWSIAFAAALLLVLSTLVAAAPDQPKKYPKPLAPSAPAEALLTHDAWRDVPATALEPGEIDRLLQAEFKESSLAALSPESTDEQFLRRIRLDLTGRLPAADEIEEFLADKDPEKRARWIDRLLDSEEYARHWARYWREAITAVEAPFGDSVVKEFEDWLCDQIHQNKNWGEVVRALMTAQGELRKDKGKDNGALFFLARHNGPDGDNVRASETVRLFLGIQIQCAQCHNDRRTGLWKQVQFHEMAGFFARMGIGGSSGQFIKATTKNNGEHLMPDRTDPKLAYITLPKFLDGKAPEEGLGDRERREALATFLTAEDNYWFSAAFVNRIWSELLGQGFYERVDDLGPKSPVVFPAVASRLAASFRGTGYDTRALIRAIVNSQAYQRQDRLGKTLEEHLKFTAVYPANLRAEVLWQALAGVLGPLPEGPQGLDSFMSEFDFDPSLKADEVSGSITQALWLLNSPVLNDRVKAQDYRLAPPRRNPKEKEKKPAEYTGPRPTLLKALLAEYGDEDPAVVNALYLHTLARRPTERERATCQQYLEDSRKGSIARTEAFEDILKALINSTEFQKKR